MLAILGYSVNDTIVIFNRLKSEWMATRTGDLAIIMDKAARVTFIRSLNTSLTTVLALTALLIFGGETIHWFVVALLAGIIVGTYSSIFVASPMLFYLAKRRA
jgi:preprotein translocase subunit SecF